MTSAYPLVYLCDDPIDDAAEKGFLQKLIKTLEKTGKPSLIVIQPSLQKSTPDFLVVLENLVAVIDIKTCGSPITGAVEGEWQKGYAQGYKESYPNLLRKLKGQKDALCNGMQQAANILKLPMGNFQPVSTALAVFWPDWHPDSKFPRWLHGTPGWYRVLTAAEFFESLAGFDHKCSWSFTEWTLFAEKHLRARLLTKSEAASDPLLLQTERQLEIYRKRSQHSFERNLPVLVEQEDFRKQLEHEERTGGVVYLQGRSGAGKSIRLKDSAARLGREGKVVIFISGETYRTSLENEIDMAAAGWTDPTLPKLLQCLHRQTTTRAVLLIDALNVVSKPLQQRLLAELALLRPLFSLIMITGQSADPDPEQRLRPRFLQLPTIRGAFREQIFNSMVPAGSPVRAIHPLMEITEDGFTLKAIAEGASDLLPEASMRDAFHHFVCRKLRQDSLELALTILRRLALHMQEEFVQAISRNDYEKFAEKICHRQKADTAIIHELRSCELMTQKGPYLRFCHERVQVFLAAEELALREEPSLEAVAQMLKKPENTIYTDLVLGRANNANLEMFEKLEKYHYWETRLPAAYEGLYGGALRNEIRARLRKLFLDYEEYLLTAKFSSSRDDDKPASASSLRYLGTYVKVKPRFRVPGENDFWLISNLQVAFRDKELLTQIIGVLPLVEEKIIQAFQGCGVSREEAESWFYDLAQVLPLNQESLLPIAIFRTLDRSDGKDDILPITIEHEQAASSRTARVFHCLQQIDKISDQGELLATIREALSFGAATGLVLKRLAGLKSEWLKHAVETSKEIRELVEQLLSEGGGYFDATALNELECRLGLSSPEEFRKKLRSTISGFMQEQLRQDNPADMPDAPPSDTPGTLLLVSKHQNGFYDPQISEDTYEKHWDILVEVWGELQEEEQRSLLQRLPAALIADSARLPRLMPMLCSSRGLQAEDFRPLLRISPQAWMTEYLYKKQPSPHLVIAWKLGVSRSRILDAADFHGPWLDADPCRRALPRFCALVQLLAGDQPGHRAQARELCLELCSEHPLTVPDLLLLLSVSAKRHAGLAQVEELLLTQYRDLIGPLTVHALVNIENQVPVIHGQWHIAWNPETFLGGSVKRVGTKYNDRFEVAIIHYWTRLRQPEGVPLLRKFIKDKLYDEHPVNALRSGLN